MIDTITKRHRTGIVAGALTLFLLLALVLGGLTPSVAKADADES